MKVFVDLWLPIPSSSKAITYPCFMHNNLYVADLHRNGAWKESLLGALFIDPLFPSVRVKAKIDLSCILHHWSSSLFPLRIGGGSPRPK